MISLRKLWIQNNLTAQQNNQIKALSQISEAKIIPIYKEEHTHKKILDYLVQTNEM